MLRSKNCNEDFEKQGKGLEMDGEMGVLETAI